MTSHSSRIITIGVILSALGLAFGPAPLAVAGPEAVAEEHVRVAASGRYEAGRVHRFLLGGGYRDLWESEIELPLLDLEREGGGLEPIGRFGGLQTAVLGFKGRDGRSFTFRGTDKDPAAVLDPLFYDTVVQALVQDQMAAQHPGGPLAAGVLTEAAGVLTVRERMVVIPDDPALGEYRGEFAGMVGTFFEYPQAAADGREGFAGAVEILDYEELYQGLETGNEIEVDVEAFLRARLLDILIGDFDRHRKQWRWAKLPGVERWQPIPEDRDQAFVRYNGLVQRVMSLYIPILQNYGDEYPGIKGLTLHGWEQDRWLLPALSWEQWEPIVRDIQSRLTDETIERAIAALPPEYIELDGERLRHDLTGRRDRLPEAARRFFEYLARKVAIRTSDASDIVRVTRTPDGSMRVRIDGTIGDDPSRHVLFDRNFLAHETAEVNLYLRGGDDQVTVKGGKGPILLRVLPEGGRKIVDDSEGGRTRVYDSDDEVEVIAGPGTHVERRPYTPPPPDPGFVDVEDVPPRDWGSDTYPLPDVGYEQDVGVFLGAAISHTRYGFRKDPWSSKHSLGFGWAFDARAPRVRYEGLFRPENSKLLAQLNLQYSGIEVLRYYGFGNDTPDTGSDKNYRARNQQLRAEANLVAPLYADIVKLSVGPFIRFSQTNQGARLIDRDNPYGNNDFGVVGGRVNLRLDTRRSVETNLHHLELPFADNPAAVYPTSGFLVDVTGDFNAPTIRGVEAPYGSIRGSISGYLSVGEDARATLGVRVGGEETFGRVPYFDAPAIGGGRFFSGSATNRGFRQRRFMGDSSVYVNTDLRLVLSRVKIVVPGDIGLMGFFDVGRVFFDQDESSDDWHPSGGGGVWFAPLVRTNAISLSVARSEEDTLVYLRAGFHY